MKKLILSTLILVLFACSESSVSTDSVASTDENSSKKPNVLLLYMDDLRPELNSYGSEQIISPNIDKLANRSVQFTQAYSNVSVCGASRASMLTGLLPTKTRFIDYNTRVDLETPAQVTLPRLLKDNGYTTISNGKVYHHLDDRTSDWDEVWRPYAFDKNEQGLSPLDYWQSLWKDYQLPENIELYKATDLGPSFERADVSDNTYIDGILTDKVVSDLKRLKNSDKPFLLTAGFIAPHLPFNAPSKYWDMYDRKDIKLPNNNYVPKNAPKVSISNWGELRAYTDIPKQGPVSDETAISLIHGYYATVSYVDALIGQIMTTLTDLELDKNTIVIFVSDHGYNLQEHTQWAKYTTYRTSTRVPLMLHVPTMGKGSTTDALVDLVDVYPTLVELLDLELPKHELAGKSLVPVLNDPTLKGKDHVFLKNGKGYTIQTHQYSYTEFINDKNKTFARMLYDHRTDVDENINVVDEADYADVVTKLSTLLHTKYASNIIGD
ncbi:sulfatase [Thalassomonas sp. M1454]|uniref:sulfatase n=1 Tax=Thalassomonas sp. M1454 TaxID=2594477 RepID=UPI00117C937A|nr:sulfatase [Thalassomonas sp. M1454]TRX53862.1 sulfatase [Thalassomonas sp. M1454]